MKAKYLQIILVLLIFTTFLSAQEITPNYDAPTGGWDWKFDGDNGTRTTDTTVFNDQFYDTKGVWDGNVIGEGAPGGVSMLVEEETFLRIQDAGARWDGVGWFGFPDPSNRKFHFRRFMKDDFGGDEAQVENFLDNEGITLHWRVRVPANVSDVVDSIYVEHTLETRPWPNEPDGVLPDSECKGMLTVYQGNPNYRFGFNLFSQIDSGYSTPTDFLGANELQGLLTNNFEADTVSEDVDFSDLVEIYETGGDWQSAISYIPLDISEWHEFWITIKPSDGPGTHTMNFYIDGNTEPIVKELTASERFGSDKGVYKGISNLGFSMNNTYQWGIMDVDFLAYKLGVHTPLLTGLEDIQSLPNNYSLDQNYPNPFNPTTEINYAVGSSGLVTIKVFDILGNEIKTLVNEQKSIGRYNVKFNADDLPSGIYLYRMSSGNFVSSKKLLLLK